MTSLDEPRRALGTVWERYDLRGPEEIERASRDVERWEWAGMGADGEIKLARRASGGTAEDPDYRDATVWVTGDSGECLLLEYHSVGIRKPRPLRLRAIIAPVCESGELREVVSWSGPGAGGAREVYEREAGRL